MMTKRPIVKKKSAKKATAKRKIIRTKMMVKEQQERIADSRKGRLFSATIKARHTDSAGMNFMQSTRLQGIRHARLNLSACIERAKDNGPLVLTKHNRPVAVLYAVTDDASLEDVLLSTSQDFLEALTRKPGKAMSRLEFKAAAGIPD